MTVGQQRLAGNVGETSGNLWEEPGLVCHGRPYVACSPRRPASLPPRIGFAARETQDRSIVAAVSEYIDLHCHYLPGVDDGARSAEDGFEILRGLQALGFTQVVATPHMRPGLFENSADGLRGAFAEFQISLAGRGEAPATALSSEHYFCDIVYARLLGGGGLPYPGGHAVLLEFYESSFPVTIDQRLADLRRRGLLPVIAHPERYSPIWKDPGLLERLLDVGAAALLDIASLAGKYGRQPRRCAEALLEQGLYHAACSDAHSPEDIEVVSKAIQRVRQLYDDSEVDYLLREGPQAILAGAIPG